MAEVEFWQIIFPQPGRTAEIAATAERLGFDGLVFTDTQNLSGDPYSGLCLAAKATERLKLGTGVTNPITRHPAITASAIATVQVESGGRAELGIGRGDSSMGYIAREPASPAALERYLRRVQGYLRGEPVALEEGQGSPNVWIGGTGLPKVPVHVAATGPRAIGIAARHAERVMFAVGADEDRLRWAVETARQARLDAGLDPAGLAMGAYVNVAPHPDRAAARELMRGTVGVYAHFAGMRGAPLELLRPEDRTVAEALGAGYDMRNHARRGASHAAYLTDDFVDRFAVPGPPDYCVERLRPLLDLGLDRLIITGASLDADPAELRRSVGLLTGEVLPALRAKRVTSDEGER